MSLSVNKECTLIVNMSGDQESCRHSVDSQGSGSGPRKQLRTEHFPSQQLDCGFERHHYSSDAFSQTGKTEQVLQYWRKRGIQGKRSCSAHGYSTTNSLYLLQSLYPLSLINGSLDEGKSGSAISRNLAAHQGYTVVAGNNRNTL